MNHLMNKTLFCMNVISLIAMVSCNNNKQGIHPAQPKADKTISVVPGAKVKTILFFGNSLFSRFLG